MDSGLLRDGLTVIAGVGTGVLSGVFGVGGAVISTPAIRLLGCSAALAVGTTLPSLLPGAATGSWRYHRNQLIDWPIVVRTVPAGVIASVIGARLSDTLPGDGHPLMLLTAALLVVSAIRMVRSPTNSASSASDNPASAFSFVLVGIVSGGLSGLLGIGGGVVMVPGFVTYGRVELKRAIATSLVCVALFAIPGTITHGLQGSIDWRFALWLAVGVVPGARLGSRLAMKSSDQRLRSAVCVFLIVVAIIYAVGEIIALR
jgi:uncharacterized protein